MRHFAPLLLILLLCGCTDTITKSDLDTKATEHAGNSFPDQTYYVGSDGSYDYFVIRSGIGGSAHQYRVLESEGAVTNRFDLTEDKTRWRGYGITSIVITNESLPPFTVRFIQMVQKNGAHLPQVEIIVQSEKSINGIEFDYRCFDSSGKDITITDITKGLHGWGITGVDPPFAPKSTNDEVVGFDTSWIPDGTVRISAVPVWAKFADGTKWHKK